MIAGLDSSFSRPSPTQVAQAWSGGVRVWGGYLATNQAPGSFNLASPWDKGSFDIVRTLGSTPIAFCSGWDDPAALKTLAAQWNVRLCLDVESGIRGDGSWVDGFLQLSGAGLYGSVWPASFVHYHAAPFHIGSRYPGVDPGITWPTDVSRPATPLAWQWEGGHSEFGLDVDRGWYDDWFGVEMLDPNDPIVQQMQASLGQIWNTLNWGTPVGGVVPQGWMPSRLADILAKIGAPAPVDVNALATALATHPLTASLSDAERDAVATHVLQHLSRDTAVG